MQQTLALDVYGTLIDTSGVLQLLRQFLGDQAIPFSDLWRNKQLEYSFRRGLMNRRVDFSVVTQEALAFCCKALQQELSDKQRKQLMEQYRQLPAFEDTPPALHALKAAGHRLFAFSNGSREAVATLLDHAEITAYFDGIVSMEEVNTFKPNPIGYAHFVQQTGASKATAWLISGNTFDVIGALSYGMQGVWLQRNPKAVFDPMGFEPTLTLNSLTELAPALTDRYTA
ncbi:MAG: haloacid dehalogenase type II [Bacteroidota bacterium]